MLFWCQQILVKLIGREGAGRRSPSNFDYKNLFYQWKIAWFQHNPGVRWGSKPLSEPLSTASTGTVPLFREKCEYSCGSQSHTFRDNRDGRNSTLSILCTTFFWSPSHVSVIFCFILFVCFCFVFVCLFVCFVLCHNLFTFTFLCLNHVTFVINL